MHVLRSLHDVRMTVPTAVAIANALTDVENGSDTIKPFDLSGISSITPRELRILSNSLEREQPEATAEGSEDEIE